MVMCQECGSAEATYAALFSIGGRQESKDICGRCYNKMYINTNDATKHVANRLTNEVKDMIFDARTEARTRRHKEVLELHCLFSICKEQNFVSDIFSSLEISKNNVKSKVELFLMNIADLADRGSTFEPEMKEDIAELFERAEIIANKIEFQEISVEIILLAILEKKSKFSDMLKKDFSLDVITVLKEMEAQLEGQHGLVEKYKNSNDERKSALERFSRDLTKMAAEDKLDPCIGRDLEVDRLVHILSRRTKNNCVLVGEPGVGKSCIAEGLAQRIVSYNVPKNLLDKKVFALDLNSMIAGTRMRGEFEERMQAVIKEVKEKSRQYIIFIDELHTLIGAGGNGSSDAANILKPALARGEMQCIGATTYDEYAEYIESDRALERRFQKVDVCEPSVDDTKKILAGIKDRYFKFHEVSIEQDVIDFAIDYSVRYIPQRYLPDKAIDLMDEAMATVKLKQLVLTKEITDIVETIKKGKSEKKDMKLFENELIQKLELITTKKDAIVTKNDIATVVSKWVGIPVTELVENEKQKLLRLEDTLHEVVIGQDSAISSLCDAIRRSRVGISSPNRPIASVIFAGKTGVGKTLIAQTIASQLFGNRENFLKLDMSEYQERHEVSKLIGAPPGYVGYEKGGQLVEHVRRHPYSVVLFDEIEKAHIDVFNSLLQIMEDGVLTDGQGKKADFRNTVIIMTSNIAATEKECNMGFKKEIQKDNYEILKNRTEEALKKHFKPEFLNRVDDILVFHELDQEDINKITNRELFIIKERLTKYNIEYDIDLVEYVAKQAFSKEYGARSIRRWIQKNIENDLAKYILSNDIMENSTIIISVQDQKIVIK